MRANLFYLVTKWPYWKKIIGCIITSSPKDVDTLQHIICTRISQTTFTRCTYYQDRNTHLRLTSWQILEVEHTPPLDCWISPPPHLKIVPVLTRWSWSLSPIPTSPPPPPTKHVHNTRQIRFLCDPLPTGHYSCNTGPILMVFTLSKREPFLWFLPPFNFPEMQLKVTS